MLVTLSGYTHAYLPVDSDVVASSIDDVDHDGVPVIDFDGWTGILTIDRDDIVGLAQPLHLGCLYLVISMPNINI